jgi:ABC-type transport system substrate-binding protein
MHKVKWIFFGYLVVIGAIVAALAVSVALTPGRDPQTLYTSYGSNVRTLDPAKISDTTSSGVAGSVFETLYNYDYAARPYKLIPELAASMPQVSPDGKTITIQLKRGVHFVDPEGIVHGWEPIPGHKARKGPQVRVGDFFYAWKRIADFHTASQNYSQIFEGKIEGLDGWWEYTRSIPPARKGQIDWERAVSGLEKIDDYTMRIRLTRPDPQMRYNLAHLPTAPMSRQVVDQLGETLKFRAVGTGPYMIADYKPEQRIVFEANPIYRGHPTALPDGEVAADQRIPRIHRVQMDYFEEDLPAWALFQQGLLDVSGIPKDTFSSAIDLRTHDLTPEMKARGIKLLKAQDPTVFYFGFNMEDPVVGRNKPLRQAMSMAFDRQRFIDLMTNGRGIPMKGIVPPGFPTYDENRRNPYAEFNLSAARERMGQAVQLHGGPIPTITLLLPGTDTYFRQLGELLQQMMKQIGVTVKIDYRTWARFQEMVDSKQAQFYSLGWQADYPDEQTFLQLFYTKNVSPGPNAANYSNPEFDRLYEQAMVMEPSPQRDELYGKMESLVLEDVPWILNMARVAYVLHYDWVQNVHPNEYLHGNRAYYRLDRQRRIDRLRSN